VPLFELPPAAEERLAQLVEDGWVTLRKAPDSCICPICPLDRAGADEPNSSDREPSSSSSSSSSTRAKHTAGAKVDASDAPAVFTGPYAWDERMEHLATAHLSNVRRAAASAGEVAFIPPPSEWARDSRLEAWLVDEGLAERDGQTGEWRCCGVRFNGRDGYAS
jgi:hypothetical protein